MKFSGFSTTEKVGIGTNAPKAELQIGYCINAPSTYGAATDNTSLIIGGPNVSLGVATLVMVGQGSGNGQTNNEILFGAGNSKSARIINFQDGAGDAIGGLKFNVFNGATETNAVTILNDGNVGIGTTAPSTKLEVVGAAGGAPITSNQTATGAGWEALLDLKRDGVVDYRVQSNSDMVIVMNTNNTSTAHMWYQVNGKYRLKLNATGYVDMDSESQVRLTLGSQGTAGTNTCNWIRGTGTNLGFNAAGGGFHWEVSGNEKMSLTSAGKLKLNTYGSGTHTGTSAYKLSVDSSGNIIETSIGSGAVDGAGTANYVAKWTDGDTIGNSLIQDNGTTVSIGGAGNAYYKFQVASGKALFDGTIVANVAESNTVSYAGILAAPLHFWGGYCSFRQATNHSLNIDVYNGGTVKAALTVLQDGKVGIGTIGPAEALHIYRANDGGDTSLRIQNADGGNSTDETVQIQFYHTGSGADGGKIVSGREGLYTSPWANADSFLAFYTSLNNANTEWMRIQSDGNVGIGTTTPAYTLDVVGEARVSSNIRVGTYGIISENSGLAINQSAYYPITFKTNNQPKMTIAADGNVGINDTTPNRKLDVNGTFRVTGASDLDGALTASSMTNTLGSAVASTNLQTILNGVASKANRIHFRESGTERWLLGQGAATETSAFELYNSVGVVAISVNRTSSLTTLAGLAVTGAADLRVTLGSQGTAGNNDSNWIRGNGTSLGFNAAGGATTWEVSGTEKMRLAAAGDLKITSAANVYLSIDSTQTNGDEWQIFNAVSGTTSGLQFKDIDTSKLVMLLQEDGKVGIGTAAPASNLHVSGNAASANYAATISNDSGGGRVLKLYNHDWDVADYLIYASNGGTASLPHFRFVVDGNARVGIGTDTPLFPLHVKNSSHFQCCIQDSVATMKLGADDGVMIGIGMNNATMGHAAGDIFIGRHQPGVSGIINGIQFSHYNGSSWVHDVRINDSGNMGIGTASPGVKLDIVEALSYTPCVELNAPHAILKMISSGAGTGYMGMGGGYLSSQPVGMFFRTESKPICWGAAGSSATHMTLNTSGNLGIGETAPAHKLSIGDVAAIHLGYNSTAANYEVGRITSNSYNVDNAAYSLAEMVLLTSSANGYTGSIQFRTNSVNSTNSRAAVRMTILSDGKVGIGATAPATTLSNTATRIANADGLTVSTSGLNWVLDAQGYVAALSNLATSDNHIGGLLVEIGATGGTNKILDLESGGVNRVRVLGNGNTTFSGTVNASYVVSTNYAQASSLRIPSTTNYHEIWNSGDELRIYRNQSAAIRIGASNLITLGGALTGTTATFSGDVDTSTVTGGTVYGGTSASNTARLVMNAGSLSGYYTENDPRFTLGRDAFGGGDVGLMLWGTAGIWRDYPSGDLKLRAGSSDRLTILSNGNVGIGTTAPSSLLHVYGSGSYLLDVHQTAVNWAARIKNTSGGGYGLSIDTSSGPAANGVYSLACYTPAGSGVFVTNQGRLGVGATAPLTPLHVKGSTGNPSTSANNGVFTLNSSNAVQLQFGSYPATPYGYWLQTKDNNNAGPYNYPLLLQPVNGNVGIGTVTPEGTLHVCKASAAGLGGQIVIDNPAASNVNNKTELSFLTDSGASGTNIRNARIVVATETASNGAANMQFHTWNGSAEGERMRISAAGTATFSGHVLPAANGTYNLGGSGNYWASCYFENTSINGTLYVGGVLTAASNVDVAQSKYLRVGGSLSTAPFSARQVSGSSMVHVMEINTGGAVQSWSLGLDTVGNYVDFVVQSEYGSGSWGERFRITKQYGCVGIGTSGPDSKLHVYGGKIHVKVTSGTGSGAHIQGYSDASTPKLLTLGTHSYGDGTLGMTTISGHGYLETYGAYDLHLRPNQSTGMVVKNGGKVGIGTVTPGGELHVYGLNNSAGDLWTVVGTGNTPNITIQNASATDNTNAALFFKNDSVYVGGIGMRFTNHSSDAAQMRFSTCTGGNTRERMILDESGHLLPAADGTYNLGSTSSQDWKELYIREIDMYNQRLRIYTSAEKVIFRDHTSIGQGLTFQARGTEVMTIGDASGNPRVGIGTTAPAYKLDVSGTVSANWLCRIDNTATTSTPSGLLVRTGYNSATATGGYLLALLAGPNYRFVVQNDGKVGIGTVLPGYMLQVNGSFAATSKSFVIDHPIKPNYTLEYGALEGPEFGVYHRGRAESDTITLPDYWSGLVRDGTITVQLTPNGSFQHLYVVSTSLSEIKIGAAEGETIDCYYTIYGERADLDPLVVEKIV